MDNEATKENNQPSTSKKDISQRSNSVNDLYDASRGGHNENVSNSETTVSATYSARSRAEMADNRTEPPKQLLGKRESKAQDKKKKGKLNGRVEKRRRSLVRRQTRKTPMRRRYVRHGRTDDRRRENSVSTIFTRMSSRSGSVGAQGCVHCGHRCCRRRYEYEKRKCDCGRYIIKRVPKKENIRARKKKKLGIKLSSRRSTIRSKKIQAGSRCCMLSPLFLNTNSGPEEVTLSTQGHCQVTPEMIHESLTALNQWMQGVPTSAIMEYLKRRYPVNQVDSELLTELREKLTIAVIAGIVEMLSDDKWSLAGELKQRKLSPNHVTQFWEAYADTLNPLPRNEKPLISTNKQSNTRVQPDDGNDII